MEIVTAPHLAVRNEWLALHREAPLQPELPIIDAHHHLWDRQTGRYLTHEFSDDIQTSGHRVYSSVYVQCRSMLRRHGPGGSRSPCHIFSAPLAKSSPSPDGQGY